MLVIYGDYESNLPYTGILREVYGPLYATSTLNINPYSLEEEFSIESYCARMTNCYQVDLSGCGGVGGHEIQSSQPLL